MLDTLLSLECLDFLTSREPSFPVGLLPVLFERFIHLNNKLKEVGPRPRGGQVSDAGRALAYMVDGLGKGLTESARHIAEVKNISAEAVIKSYRRFLKSEKNLPAKKRPRSKKLRTP